MTAQEGRPEKKEIYFHVGLGKTGTTFLQYRAFPHFEGFEYIQRTRFHKAKDIVREGTAQRYFISFECDRQLEEVVKDWARDFPDTIPIICFRRQDSWIASQYRRFVKNCHVRSFPELFDIKNDQGIFKKEHLLFRPMIDLLENHFSHPPIVVFHDDLKKDAKAFISNLAKRMGSKVDVGKLDLSSKHSSYSPRQLRFLMRVSHHIDLQKRVIFKNKVLEFFRKSMVNGTRYLILFIGRFWPDNGKGPLMTSETKEEIRQLFEDDWALVSAYTSAR